MTRPTRASPSECPPLLGGSPIQLPIFQPLPHWSPHLGPLHSLSSSSSGGWHTSHLSSSLSSSLLTPQLPPQPMDRLPGGPTPIAQVIKSGWLDKNPPQG